MAEGAIAAFAAPFRVGPPLIATSRIVDPAAADGLVADGVADAVGMTRALITDPDMPRKAAEGRAEDALRCIGCNTCIAHYHLGIPIACAQNPRTGRERHWTPVRAVRRQRIAVVGGGPAGMMAAAEASAAGHDVVLYEREERLGGQAALAGVAPGQAELASALARNFDRLLDAVDVRLGELVEGPVDADAVVLATGARPFEPELALGEIERLQSWDVLGGSRPDGRAVVVADWGGDLSGLDTAELLAGEGFKVVLAVGSAALGETIHQYRRNLYAARLYRAGVTVVQHVKLQGAGPGGLRFTNLFAPELESTLAADAVVLALGRVPARELAIAGAEEAGDRLAPRSLEEAILEGALAGRAVAQRATLDATGA